MYPHERAPRQAGLDILLAVAPSSAPVALLERLLALDATGVESIGRRNLPVESVSASNRHPEEVTA